MEPAGARAGGRLVAPPDADPEREPRRTAGSREVVVRLIDEHHALIGAVVEEQMDRLSPDQLTQLIQDRVGEDLNWIRLNGTFVGGLIGVALYLTVAFLKG